MKFSQRIGKTPVRRSIQVESIDDALRNRLWSMIIEDFFGKLDYSNPGGESQAGKICEVTWKEFFQQPIDKISRHYAGSVDFEDFIGYMRIRFFSMEWFEIYDLLEHLVHVTKKILPGFARLCNRSLEKEVSGYRILKGKVVQITSEHEILAIEEALDSTDKQWATVTTHLTVALKYLSDRQNPDFRNSIKEAISAVEAACQTITGDKKATLGKALNRLEKTHSLHGALKEAFSKLYGYTNDEGGIRHALTESGVAPDVDDAKFMLVSCSAFISYLKVKFR